LKKNQSCDAEDIKSSKICLVALDFLILCGALLSLSYVFVLLCRFPAWAFYPVAGVSSIAFALFLSLKVRGREESANIRRRDFVWLVPPFILAIASLFYFRVSFDDMYYLHNAMHQSTSHIGDPLFRYPTAFKDTRLEASITNVLQAYQVIPAFVARPLGLDPVFFHRNIVGAIVVFVFGLAYMEWFRRLGFSFRYIVIGFSSVVFFLLFDGNTRQSYGVYSIGLFWVGRSVLIGALVPLLWINLFRVIEKPCWKNSLILLSTTIVAIASSSSAMFLVPSLILGTLVVHIAISRSKKKLWRTGLFLLMSLIYWLGIVLIYLVEGSTSADVKSNMTDVMSRMYGENYFGNLVNVFDNYFKLSAYLVATMILPWFVLRKESARLISLVSVGIFVVIANPLTGPVLQDVVTRLAFCRFFYLIPVPLCFGLAAISLVCWKSNKWGAVIGVSVIVLNFLGFERSLFQPHAKYRYDFTALKMPWEPRYFPEEYKAVAEVSDEMKGRYILAPKHFMMVAGLLHPEHKYESTRDLMTTIAYRASGLEDEGKSRGAAQNFVQAKNFQGSETEKAFRESIERGVDLILVEFECVEAVEQVLASEGMQYEKREIAGIYMCYLMGNSEGEH